MTRQKTILTIDDSRTMRDMLRLALTEAGYNVLQAADGLEGLAVLRDLVPDAVITDINMPVLDGFGFIEKARANARFRDMPILVLTTESTPAMKDRARQAGATGWITKPFDPEKLTSALLRVGA
ncbi:response regulator [uncultured Brevundimonas sp.]|uniref:response regulator n=1 Tax=uncultured Brevundimonas sp. TaxID=213418 RepID=UPI0030EB3E98|tara:strand:- start:8726 stop:9097 length:372 start_codon:yes stop_codon:yes gene_type:complete